VCVCVYVGVVRNALGRHVALGGCLGNSRFARKRLEGHCCPVLNPPRRLTRSKPLLSLLCHPNVPASRLGLVRSSAAAAILSRTFYASRTHSDVCDGLPCNVKEQNHCHKRVPVKPVICNFFSVWPLPRRAPHGILFQRLPRLQVEYQECCKKQHWRPRKGVSHILGAVTPHQKLVHDRVS
jgi:hypothetical protein